MTQHKFRENPAKPVMSYPGMTWLTAGNKEIACVGVGEEIRAAMIELAEKTEEAA